MEANNLLQINNLKVEFSMLDGSTLYAVNGVSFSLKTGETLGIVGESGSGKSQTMLSLMGLLAKNAKITGEAIFAGQNLLSLSQEELNKIRGKDISMIFQDPMTSLNPYLKIKTQMVEALEDKHILPKKEAESKALDMLRLVGISDPEKRLNFYPHQISGGMRQRVMIAMAILSNPKLLIADEPTTALDVTIQAQILNILVKLKKQLGLSIIMVTHDLGVVANLCDKVAIFYGGKIVELGDIKTIFKNPLHPYTKALLNSIPRIDQEKKEKLTVIPGYPKMWKEEPNLCVFKDRCEQKLSKCEVKIPELKASKSNNNTKVSCWLEESNAK